MPVYRYQLTLFDAVEAGRQVPGSLTEGASAPPVYKDITAPSGSKADLDDYMARKGFVFVSTDPVTTPAQEQAAADFSVHTNIAGEIAGVTTKATPTGSDLLLIEDAAAANAKKKVLISTLPSPVSSVFGRTGAVTAASNDYSAAQVSFSPSGNIAATTVQAAVVEVRDESVQDGDAAGGQLGGTYPNPDVRGIRETGGPTLLTLGAVADGQFLQRSGSTLVGGTGSAFDPRDQILAEHFLSNNVSSAQSTVGTANWIVSATGTGNAQAITGESGHPGIINLTNGTAATSRSAVHLGNTTFCNILATGASANPINYECLVSPRTSVAAANLLRLQLGLGNGWALAAPNPLTDGIYFRLEPSLSANWIGVVASASTRTTVDTGVAATVGNWYRLGWTWTGGGTPQVQFKVNGSNVGSPVTTNIPTVLVGPGFRTDANAGTACSIFIDYVTISQVTAKET